MANLAPPFVAVEGVPNFRDLGGHPCHPPSTLSAEQQQGSWCIRPGFLFRSAQPSQITVAGVETLTKTLRISAVFDFRSETEIQLVASRYPDSLLCIPGTTRYAIPVFEEEGDYSPISLAKRYGTAQTVTTAAATSGFVKAYEEIALQAARTGSFRSVMLQILQEPDHPILFHCTLGKDRTGVFAALLLKLCGVADEEVVAEYALTTIGIGAWRKHLIQRLLQRGDAATHEQAEAIVASDPGDMRGFLADVVDTKFGGAQRYFVDQCGLSESEVDSIVASLVVSVN
ncbi:hypothetical protein ASPZODRAFT_77467 [Penicilliopsis zonata CBS 506.65]|uniref:Tyrosine specific protein phosphatases domain-containing protein n=1 Tax=Penicilliopsis zonata CBS 506.65 TaxID=1073090 RepID=A0A1L9S4X2_9EURO|nr:hypothetical protein ASPZODRAFT_77467 [Penicilliopsis zonata CBS 506.65]OJJ42194.1 hypothetical protein ASPZODRAFT_77467 [Penicilliopsis zonata CBS 506.65]